MKYACTLFLLLCVVIACKKKQLSPIHNKTVSSKEDPALGKYSTTNGYMLCGGDTIKHLNEQRKLRDSAALEIEWIDVDTVNKTCMTNYRRHDGTSVITSEY